MESTNASPSILSSLEEYCFTTGSRLRSLGWPESKVRNFLDTHSTLNALEKGKVLAGFQQDAAIFTP